MTVETVTKAVARPSPFLDVSHGLAYFFNDPQDLMPDDGTLLQLGTSLIHVQIAATNAARCHFENGIGRRN